MGTTQLKLYNDALLLAGERALSGLTESVETRRLLDQVWADGGVDSCLEEGQWEFAMRAVEIDYDTTVVPPFGYNRAFSKPSDWIRTSALCSDEFFRVPLTRYFDEANYWYSDLDLIYVRYVSNDSTYGKNLDIWPQSFVEFAAAHFANKLILKTTNDEARRKLFDNPENPRHSIRGRALLHAKSLCASSSAPQFIAQGNWTRSRTRGVNRRDGGGTSNLIG